MGGRRVRRRQGSCEGQSVAVPCSSVTTVGESLYVQPWEYDARCQIEGMDTSFFFPSERETKKVKAAKAFCSGCLCRFDCMMLGIYWDAEGIFGGATQSERRMMAALLAIQESQDSHADTNVPTDTPVTHIVHSNLVERVEQLPASPGPLFQLDVQVGPESHILVLEEASPAPTEHGLDVSPIFVLRVS